MAVPQPPKTKLRYRFMQGYLDKLGLITNIDQVGKKHFVFYINGEATKSSKTRKTCNKQIEKIFIKNYSNE